MLQVVNGSNAEAAPSSKVPMARGAPCMTVSRLVELFGEGVRLHAPVVIALYDRHTVLPECATSSLQPPELKVNCLEMGEVLVTIRGNAYIDTQGVRELDLGTDQYNRTCVHISVDYPSNSTIYRLNSSAESLTYERGGALDANVAEREASALCLPKGLTKNSPLLKRMQLIAELYSRHHHHEVPEFDLYTIEETDYTRVVITNVLRCDACLLFMILRNKAIGCRRACVCPAAELGVSNALRHGGELNVWLPSTKEPTTSESMLSKGVLWPFKALLHTMGKALQQGGPMRSRAQHSRQANPPPPY